MAWAKFDDSFYDHPKVMYLLDTEPMALVLFVRSVSYCARHQTDGWLSNSLIEALVPLQRDREAQVKALLDQELWHVHEDGRTYVHDYLDYNPSKKQIAEKRAKDRDRKKGGGDA